MDPWTLNYFRNLMFSYFCCTYYSRLVAATSESSFFRKSLKMPFIVSSVHVTYLNIFFYRQLAWAIIVMCGPCCGYPWYITNEIVFFFRIWWMKCEYCDSLYPLEGMKFVSTCQCCLITLVTVLLCEWCQIKLWTAFGQYKPDLGHTVSLFDTVSLLVIICISLL